MEEKKEFLQVKTKVVVINKRFCRVPISMDEDQLIKRKEELIKKRDNYIRKMSEESTDFPTP